MSDHEFTVDDFSEPHWMPGTANVYFDVQMPHGEIGHVIAGVNETTKDVVWGVNHVVKGIGPEAAYRAMLSPDGLTL